MFARKATPCLLDLNPVLFLYLLSFCLHLYLSLNFPAFYLSLSICRNLDPKFETDQNGQNGSGAEPNTIWRCSISITIVA